jgi:hypothetical protein
MLVTSAVMGATSLLRVGVGCLELWSRRMPALMEVGQQMRDPKAAPDSAAGRFRDELIAIARDSSEIALRELRRGVDDLDEFTRPDEPPSKRPKRPYKAKP